MASRVLRDMELRKYAGPFDWVYSNEEVVRHCLGDSFATFLDPRHLIKSGFAWGHKAFGAILGRGVVFPHHEPKTKDRVFFQRAVERFNKVAISGDRKLFLLVVP